MELKAHLESYGIRHFDDESYWEWRDRALGQRRLQELDELRQPLREGHPASQDLAAYWDFVAHPDIASPFFSLKADAIRAAGDFVARHLPASGHILDIGCSIGYLTTYYAFASPNAEVTGWDVSPESIKRAELEAGRRGVHNVRFRQADWVQELPAERYDLVAATQVLAFSWQDQHALAQLASLLAGGGHLVCVESLDEAETESFVSACTAHGLALQSLEMLYSSDAGARDECPGFVFEKIGSVSA